MMNQVLFGNLRSYTDLGLFLTDAEIGTPEPKRTVVEVPGRNGSLDLTYALSGEITYKNRSIKLTFAMADYQHRWTILFSQILAQLHGKLMQVQIEPDTSYYWDAFCKVNTVKSDRNLGTIVVELDAYPFKKKTVLTTYDVSGTTAGHSQICVCDRMPVVPNFYATQACVLAFGSITKNLAVGNNSFTDIVFHEGNSKIIVTGTGATVTVSYREGRL